MQRVMRNPGGVHGAVILPAVFILSRLKQNRRPFLRHGQQDASAPNGFRCARARYRGRAPDLEASLPGSGD